MMARGRSGQGGFTLLEVMLALSIMFMALVVLIDRTAHDVYMNEQAQRLGVATELSRSKMYDLEELLLRDGFQELDQEEDGDFSDEERDDYAWEAKIEKIELPPLGGLDALSGEGEGEGEGTGGGGGIADSPLASLMSMGGGGLAGAEGASLIASQYELLSKVLESAIRKVTLKVTWKVGDRDEELVTTAYFTDPAAVNKSLLGGLAGAGGSGGGDGDGDDPGGRNPE